MSEVLRRYESRAFVLWAEIKQHGDVWRCTIGTSDRHGHDDIERMRFEHPHEEVVRKLLDEKWDKLIDQIRAQVKGGVT